MGKDLVAAELGAGLELHPDMLPKSEEKRGHLASRPIYATLCPASCSGPPGFGPTPSFGGGSGKME
jgi:hypothetical protein